MMRLDQVLVDYFNIESRTKAQALIDAGKVCVRGKVINKSSYNILDEDRNHIKILESEVLKFVSRAGLKLEKALTYLGLSVTGKRVLDIGQSTGGFSDCVLQLGARSVVGVDVGHGQLHAKLRQDSRCVCIENTNVKALKASPVFLDLIAQDGLTSFDLLVMDVSFISLNQVVPHIVKYLKADAEYLVLVKPQFECGPQLLDKQGRVRDHQFYSILEKNMRGLFEENLGPVHNYFQSDLLGKEGNIEFFIYGKKSKN